MERGPTVRAGVKFILPLEMQGLRVIAAPIPLTSLSDDAAALKRTLARTKALLLSWDMLMRAP
jgi:hypothetical protein